jgi:hypothetical protein
VNQYIDERESYEKLSYKDIANITLIIRNKIIKELEKVQDFPENKEEIDAKEYPKLVPSAFSPPLNLDRASILP